MDKRKFNRVPEDTSQQQMFVEEVIGHVNMVESTLPHKADLGEDGKVPAEQLPSYVDDIVEYATRADFPEEGESGKIYVALDTGYSYRWSGTTYTMTSTNPIVKITYADLKALRDAGKLIPGQSYQIIDYTATTSQLDTNSASHMFDIIIVADSKYALNENARAAYHFDNPDEIKAMHLRNNGTFIRYFSADGDYNDEHYYAFRRGLEFVYTKSLRELPTEDTVYCFNTDSANWVAISEDGISISTVKDDDDDKVIEVFYNDYFAKCNIAAWQIKYCLDNDAKRFSWACTEEEEGALYDGEVCPYIGTYDYDGKTYYEFLCNGDYHVFALTRYPQLNDGLYIYEDDEMILDDTFAGYQFSGRGVIYWMKDEWNNECPYDFKNIRFKRCFASSSGDVTLPTLEDSYCGIPNGQNLGLDVDETDYVWMYTFCGYNDEISDTDYFDCSVKMLINSTEAYATNEFLIPNSNVIKECYVKSMIDDDNMMLVQTLNDIVFIQAVPNESGFAIRENTVDADCMHIHAEVPIGNYFDKHCHDMIFGLYAFNNHFGNNCHYITADNDFKNNSLSSDCYNILCSNRFIRNTLGSESKNCQFDSQCQNNSFGIGATEIVTGTNFFDNTIGNAASEITAGNNCRSNSFGNKCTSIELSNYCINCAFGDNCSYIYLPDDYYDNVIIENDVAYVTLLGSSGTSLYVTNVKLCQGLTYTVYNQLVLTETRGSTRAVEYKLSTTETKLV